MHVSQPKRVLGILAFLSGSLWCPGQEGPNTAKQLKELKAQMTAMQRQMGEMQRRHEKEIKSLNERIRSLRDGKGTAMESEEELDLLRRLAATEAAQKLDGESLDPAKTFKAGGLSLQSLNPEISVTGDLLAFYRSQEDNRQRSHADFRTLGLHFESYLDPYTKFKAAVPVSPGGAALGEAYMTHYGMADGLNVTFGKFRQQFGVVNRWHKHGLDQVDFPLALREIFGNGGLNQTGVSLEYTLPELLGSSQELTLQVTNGENPRLFSGNMLGTPSLLMRYKNFRELNEDTYFEFGLSALAGWRDAWEVWRTGVPETEYDTARDCYFTYWDKVEREYSIPYHPNVTMGWDPSPRTVQSDAYLNVGYPFTATLANNTPESFQQALEMVKTRVDQRSPEHKIVSINAWNEWTESSYLEPDTVYGMRYLAAIKEVFGSH